MRLNAFIVRNILFISYNRLGFLFLHSFRIRVSYFHRIVEAKSQCFVNRILL